MSKNTTPMSKPLIVIVGATGGQGGSVARSFLSDGTYKVRGITRNPTSPKAAALSESGVEVVPGDLNDISSLVKAFEGAQIIYAVTNFFELYASLAPEAATKIETEQGINLAKAASLTPSLTHYIWSTMANPSKISRGKYQISHYIGKNAVDDYIKNDAALLSKTTFLWNTYYASNIHYPFFSPSLLKSAGKYIMLSPISHDTILSALGDQNKNIGTFALSIVKNPALTLPGKFVLAETEKTTNGELLRMWSEATGKKADYIQISVEDFETLWPGWGSLMGHMLKYYEEFGDKSWGGEEVVTAKQLGIQQDELVSVKQAFQSFEWDI